MTEPSNLARRTSVWRRLRVSRVGVAIAIIVFLVLGGTGAYAYWTTTTQMTNTATSGALGITGTWTVPITATFTNVTYAVPAASTAQYTVTNNTNATGSQHNATSMPYSVAFSASGANAGPLSSVLDVWVWKSSTTSLCSAVTPPTSTSAAHWGGSPLPSASGGLKPGESDVWCVRTGVDERSKLASASGSVSISTSLIATLSLPGTSWTKASVAATGTQQTQLIYPAYVPPAGTYRMKTSLSGKECADIRSNGGNGTDLIAYQCNSPISNNQRVKFTPTNTGYIKMVFQHNTALTVGVAGASFSTGASIHVQSNTATDGSQEWQLQQKSAGRYQIVNRRSGLCMEPDATDTSTTPRFRQQVCSGAAVQEFSLDYGTAMCTNTPTNRADDAHFKIDWTGSPQEALTVQVRQASTPDWIDNGTVAAGTTEWVIQHRSTLKSWPTNASHEYRLVNGAQLVRAAGTFTVVHYNGIFGWGAYDYLRCG